MSYHSDLDQNLHTKWLWFGVSKTHDKTVWLPEQNQLQSCHKRRPHICEVEPETKKIWVKLCSKAGSSKMLRFLVFPWIGQTSQSARAFLESSPAHPQDQNFHSSAEFLAPRSLPSRKCYRPALHEIFHSSACWSLQFYLFLVIVDVLSRLSACFRSVSGASKHPESRAFWEAVHSVLAVSGHLENRLCYNRNQDITMLSFTIKNQLVDKNIDSFLIFSSVAGNSFFNLFLPHVTWHGRLFCKFLN